MIPEPALGTIDDFRGWHLPVVQDVQLALSDIVHRREAIDETLR